MPRNSSVVATRVSVAAGRQAVEELRVYMRALSAAQRRWHKTITAQESHVRKLMMVEDQCRNRLKRSVLRGTYANLKYLVNTDLLSASQVAAPPPLSVFEAYGISASQVNGFSMYVMARLCVDPDRIEVPPEILVADLLGAWEVVAPTKKAEYEALAEQYRLRLDCLQQSKKKKVSSRRGATAAAASATRGTHAEKQVASAHRKVKAAAHAAATSSPSHKSSSSRDQAGLEAFTKASFTQMRSALGKGVFTAKEWSRVAEAEWAAKTVRQRSIYYPDK